MAPVRNSSNWPRRIVILVVLLVAIGATSYYFAANPGGKPVPQASPGADPGDGDSATGGQGQTIDGIPCQPGEALTYHVHAHLSILLDGVPQPVSAQVGIVRQSPISACIYWMHTHDRTGVIHIEAPAPRTFLLGSFFKVWGRPLDRSAVSTLTVPGGDLTIFVDGQQYTGDPTQIELKAHTQVVIELGQPAPPPPFDFGNL